MLGQRVVQRDPRRGGAGARARPGARPAGPAWDLVRVPVC